MPSIVNPRLLVTALLTAGIAVPLGLRPAPALGQDIPQTKAEDDSSKTRSSDGRIGPGYLGILTAELKPERKQALMVQQGVEVTVVRQGTPGEETGLKRGDVILRLEGREVLTDQDLSAQIRSHSAGDRVILSILRDGKPIDVTVTLGDWLKVSHGDLGISYSQVTSDSLDTLKVTQGVVVDYVFQDRAGDKAGLNRNDVIQKVDGKEILSPQDLTGMVLEHLTGEPLTLGIVRDGKPLDLTVTLGEIPVTFLRKLTGHEDAVNSIAFSSDGKMLASASDDGTVRLWDVQTGKLLRILKGHSHAVASVAFSPDGRALVSGGDEVKLWDAQTGEERKTLDLGTRVNCVSFSPGGNTFVTGSSDHTARLWDPQTGIVLQSLKEHDCSCVSWVAFSPDGTMLASSTMSRSDGEGEVKLWNPETGELERTVSEGAASWNSIAFSPDGRTLVGGNVGSPGTSGAGAICLWDTATGKLKRSMQIVGTAVGSVVFSPDGKLLASGDWSIDGDSAAGGVGVWDAQTGNLKFRFTPDRRFVNSVAFSPDGKTLATAGSDHTVKLWRLKL